MQPVIPYAYRAIGGTRDQQRLADAGIHARHARAVAHVGEVLEAWFAGDLGEGEGKHVDLVVVERACEVLLGNADGQAFDFYSN